MIEQKLDIKTALASIDKTYLFQFCHYFPASESYFVVMFPHLQFTQSKVVYVDSKAFSLMTFLYRLSRKKFSYFKIDIGILCLV